MTNPAGTAWRIQHTDSSDQQHLPPSIVTTMDMYGTISIDEMQEVAIKRLEK